MKRVALRIEQFEYFRLQMTLKQSDTKVGTLPGTNVGELKVWLGFAVLSILPCNDGKRRRSCMASLIGRSTNQCLTC